MLLSFNFNKNLLYLPIFMVVNIIQFFIEGYFKTEEEYFYSFFSYIIQIFLIIFYFYEKYFSKNKINKDNNYYKMNLKIIILIIFLLIISSINEYILNLYDVNQKDDFIVFILFFIMLEKLLFNQYFYSHQIVSIIMISILFLYYFFTNIIESKLNLLYFLFLLSKYSYTFILVLIKYINTKYFMNIYLLSSICGFFGIIQFPYI